MRRRVAVDVDEHGVHFPCRLSGEVALKATGRTDRTVGVIGTWPSPGPGLDPEPRAGGSVADMPSIGAGSPSTSTS